MIMKFSSAILNLKLKCCLKYCKYLSLEYDLYIHFIILIKIKK